MKENKFFVGDLATHFGVSRDTIRLYDKMGLLHPTEIGENKYRIYTREDFICMDYIMRLRKLNMPLEEIKELVNSSNIERSEATMQIQAKNLEEKIEELKNLQTMVNDYRKSFSSAILHMGQIMVETSPCIIYQKIDGSIADVMQNFNRLTTAYIPKFTFLMSIENFLSEESWADFENSKERSRLLDYAVTLIDDNRFAEKLDLEQMGFMVTKPQKSVHAYLKVQTNRDYTDFRRCRNFIVEQGYQLVGEPIFRVVSIRYNDTAYYEFWAPIL